MFDALVSAIDKLVVDFTWRRVFTWICIVVLVGSVAWGLESYTGYFRLARIEKSIQLLRQLGEAERAGVAKSDAQLAKIYNEIKSDFDEFLKRSDAGIEMPSEFSKGLAGAAPWLLMGVAFLFRLRNGEQDSIYGLSGAIVLAVLFGIVGALLPDFRWRWINFLAYPIAVFLVFIIGVVTWQRWKDKAGKSRDGLTETENP